MSFFTYGFSLRLIAMNYLLCAKYDDTSERTDFRNKGYPVLLGPLANCP